MLLSAANPSSVFEQEGWERIHLHFPIMHG